MNSNKNMLQLDRQEGRTLSPSAALTIQLALLAIIVAALIVVSNRSFDHTDEAYYVAWIRSPTDFQFLYQPFSHFFKPFYDLFSRPIVSLRLLGYAMLAGSGALLGLYCQRYYDRRYGIVFARSWLAIIGALFSLVYYASWLLTPSYNLLVNTGASLLMAGCLGWLTPPRDGPGGAAEDRAASLLVGVGGCLAFFGKPTFAALAALAVLALLLIVLRQRGLRPVVERASIVAVTCLIPLYLIISYTQPLGDFVETVVAGTQAIRFGNSIAEVPLKALREFYDGPPILFVVLTTFAFCVAKALRPSDDPRSVRNERFLVVAVSVAVLLSLLRAAQAGGWFLPLMTLCGVLCMISYGLLGGHARQARLGALGFVFVLLVTPFAIAIGSANPLLFQIGASSYTLLFAAVLAARILFGEGTERRVATGLSVAVVALMLFGSLKPYGMPQPMYRQTVPVDLGFTPDRLYVDAPTREYIDGMRTAAARVQLPPGTPIVDLSGSGPGNTMFLGGRAPAFPWLVNFTDGAPILVDAVWSAMTPADRANAWILGPVHPGMRKAKLVARLDVDQSGYRCVASIPNGYWADKQAVLTIWRPRKAGEPATVPACPDARIVPAGLVDR